MTTTAIVKHRDRVPYGWIAIKFCDVEFLGPLEDELNNKWHDIEFKKYRQNKEKIEECETTKKILDDKIKDFQKQINKPWYRFWYNSEEKEKLEKIRILEDDIMNCEIEIEELNDNNFYEASEKLRLVKNFLTENGFVLHSTSAAGEECITHTDIWHHNP